MSISKYPSKVALPQRNPGVVTVLEYLISKFPQIASSVWQQRVADGKVHWRDGTLISAKTPYHAQQLVYYYREVTSETTVPFIEEILFQDAEILVAYKPHFLAVTPGGIHVGVDPDAKSVVARYDVHLSEEQMGAWRKAPCPCGCWIAVEADS